MKIQLPYTFTEAVIPPRCRKPRSVRREATIKITIKEISSADAPVAFRWHSHEFNESEEYVPTVKVYRVWNGKLWTQAKFRRIARGKTETQNMAAFTGDPWPYSLTHADENGKGYQSQDENKKQFRQWARGIAFIDGERWSEANEPRYVVMTFGLGHNHGIGWGTSIRVDTYYNSNISRDRYFRIDQLQEAINAATEIATRRGDTKALPIEDQEPDRFEILMPEVLKLHPNKQHGKGDPFINKCESLIESSPDASIARRLLMALPLA